MKIFTTYILFSGKLSSFYTGHTDNLTARLKRHNTGGSTFTSNGCPWESVYQKTFTTRQEAIAYEKKIKKIGARNFLTKKVS